jgi:hypothetical protein
LPSVVTMALGNFFYFCKTHFCRVPGRSALGKIIFYFFKTQFCRVLKSYFVECHRPSTRPIFLIFFKCYFAECSVIFFKKTILSSASPRHSTKLFFIF